MDAIDKMKQEKKFSLRSTIGKKSGEGNMTRAESLQHDVDEIKEKVENILAANGGVGN